MKKPSTDCRRNEINGWERIVHAAQETISVQWVWRKGMGYDLTCLGNVGVCEICAG